MFVHQCESESGLIACFVTVLQHEKGQVGRERLWLCRFMDSCICAQERLAHAEPTVKTLRHHVAKLTEMVPIECHSDPLLHFHKSVISSRAAELLELVQLSYQTIAALQDKLQSQNQKPMSAVPMDPEGSNKVSPPPPAGAARLRIQPSPGHSMQLYMGCVNDCLCPRSPPRPNLL